ncbi:hypothetical protein [Streptomyces sp. NPDC089919]|uniref:hypothetical protein n=1 Tax=Streptomyces sp. NPDC089919 TaxID=3155188 RepID=UPI00343208EF
MSLLYQVLEPLPDASGALGRARALLAEFGEPEDDPCPGVGPAVTAEQFRHARRYFTLGCLTRTDGGSLRPAELGELWHVISRTGALAAVHDYGADVELRPELAEAWPLLEAAGLQVELRAWDTPPFPETDEHCTEAELDTVVRAAGPLELGVYWYAAFRGLPSSKLCGVQLCLNSRWSPSGGTVPAPGTHAVYLSIGTRNRDVADTWLKDTGLRLGPALWGW